MLKKFLLQRFIGILYVKYFPVIWGRRKMKNFYIYGWNHNPIWDAAEADHFVENGYRLNWSGDWIANVGSSRGIGLVVYGCDKKYQRDNEEIVRTTVEKDKWDNSNASWVNVRTDEQAAKDLVSKLLNVVSYDSKEDKLYNGRYDLKSVGRETLHLVKSELENMVESFPINEARAKMGLETWEEFENLETKTRYHLNVQPKSKINYFGGDQHGLCQWWHENGQLWYEGKFVKGEEQGLSQSWYNDGQPKSRLNYVKGKLISSERWDENKMKKK